MNTPAHALVNVAILSSGAGMELTCVITSTCLLWRRFEGLWLRGFMALLSASGATAYLYFYWLRT